MPLPDGPTMATKAPCGIAKFTSRNTVNRLSPLRYSLDRFRATSMRMGSPRVNRNARRGLAVLLLVAAYGVACSTGSNAERRQDQIRCRRGPIRNLTAPRWPSRSTARGVVLFAGTSLTAGLGLSPDSAYPMLIQQKIDSAGLPFEVVNAGVSGETSSGLLDRLAWLLRARFDVLVVETGANDGLRGIPRIDAPGESRDRARPNTRHVGRTRRSRSSRWKRCRTSAPSIRRNFIASIRRSRPEKHVTLMPFLLDGVAGQRKLNQADGVHPNIRRRTDRGWEYLEVAPPDSRQPGAEHERLRECPVCSA